MWGLRVGLPEQYSLVQYFRQEKAEIAAIRQEESAPQKPKHVSKLARLVWSAKKRLALNDIRAQPFNLQPKIKMHCCRSGAGERETAQATRPIVIKAGERPDSVQLLQHGKPVKRKPERNRQNCSKLTTQQPLLIHVKLPLKQLSPAPKRASWNSNGLMRNQKNRSSAQSRRRSRYCPCQSAQAGTATV